MALNRPSEGGKLKILLEDRFGVSHALPENAGPGNAATIFVLSVQAPIGFGTLDALRDFLTIKYGLVAAPEIVEIESAIDWVDEHHDPDALKAITTRLMQAIMPPTANNPRMCKGRDDIFNYSLPHRRGIETDRTLYIGHQGDDVFWRIYWKQTDDTFIGECNQRIPKPLPVHMHCARVEVRITGAALHRLGLFILDDLASFSFEKLHSAGLFKFGRRNPDGAALTSNAYTAAAFGRLGVHDKSPACVLGMFGRLDGRRRTLKVSRHLMTDTELTEAARNALRGLTARWGSKALAP